MTNQVSAVLTVQPLRPLSPSERCAVEAEADRLLAFTNPDATHRHTTTAVPTDGSTGFRYH